MVEAVAPYLTRSLLAGALVAVPLGLLGCFVLLRSLAFFAHAVGVATFPGLAIGAAVPGLGGFVGALAAALAFSGLVTLGERDRALSGGAVTGVVLAAALAIGAILLVSLDIGALPVERLLFGSLLAVSDADVARSALAAALAGVVLSLGLRRLAAATFDREWAAPAGARVRVTDAAVIALVAICIVCALPAAGSLLAAALVVVPAATARLLTERLGPMLAWAVVLAVGEMAGGLMLGRALGAPPGAAVSTLAGAVFAVVAMARAVTGRLLAGRPA